METQTVVVGEGEVILPTHVELEMTFHVKTGEHKTLTIPLSLCPRVEGDVVTLTMSFAFGGL